MTKKKGHPTHDFQPSARSRCSPPVCSGAMSYSLEQITTVSLYGFEFRKLTRESDHDLYSLRSVRKAFGLEGRTRQLFSAARLVREDHDFWTDRILFGKASSGGTRHDMWITWQGVMTMMLILRPDHSFCTQIAWQVCKAVCIVFGLPLDHTDLFSAYRGKAVPRNESVARTA